ncbi:MAG: TolC family protein, partial [Gammaproteobacteria bacterium]
PSLKVDIRTLHLPGVLKPHPFDPSDGLDMTEIAALAVVNNPKLKVARAERGIARAQLLAAGLLPDPKWDLSLDHPTGAGVQAYSLSLGYPIQRLITRRADVKAAKAAVRKADLDLLWQEWQVAQKAKLLFVQWHMQEKRLHLIKAFKGRSPFSYEKAMKAMDRGELTLETGSPFLAAMMDADKRLNALEREHLQTRHELLALLGLSPAMRLPLVKIPPLPPWPSFQASLVRHRPDLLALKAGYESQESRLRSAVLARFPGLTFGLDRARDTDGVHTLGFSLTLRFPLWNRNRGEIAVQKATRERLRAEYQARLNQAVGDIRRLQEAQALLRKQHTRLKEQLSALEPIVAKAREAFASGNLDALRYVSLEENLLNRREDMIGLEQASWEVYIASQTLAGSLW